MYRLNAILIKSQQVSVHIDKIILEFISKGKETRIKTILEKKNKVKELSLDNFKIYSITTVIMTMEGYT